MQKIKANRKNTHNKGAAMLIVVMFALFISMTVVMGVIVPILKQADISKNIINSKESFYLASGALEDAVYRLKNGLDLVSGETLVLNGYTTTITLADTAFGKTVNTSSDRAGVFRKMQSEVVLGSGTVFNYGVQAGQGGFTLTNSSRIIGNVYSNGPVVGAGNTITGNVVSVGASGLIRNIRVTGSAYANTIADSNITQNAYYVTKTNTTVSGTSYPNSPDQAPISLPISDTQITELENDAASGGTISSPCPYVISSNTIIGPKKINCDLEISGSATVTLLGSLWVTGNVTIKNSAIIKVSSTLGNKSLAIIADKTTNRTTSSKIELSNSTQFLGSGDANSFIFLISQNNSAELGGSEEAIEMDNSASGKVVLYASHGLITINNSATLKEVTAYKISMKNSATLTYDTGLVNTLFPSGPGGGWDVTSWKEVE